MKNSYKFGTEKWKELERKNQFLRVVSLIFIVGTLIYSILIKNIFLK